MKLKLRDLSPSDLALYRDMRLESVKPSTLHRQFCILRHACRIASEEWEWESPYELFKGIRLPQIINKPVYRTSNQTVAALLASADRSRNDYIKDIIILALETGMRRGELTALKWKDFDQDRQLLTVAQSLLYRQNFKNDKTHGLYEEFDHRSGKLQSRANYRNGIRYGFFEWYHENGQIAHKGNKGDNQNQIGIWEHFDENGNLTLREHFDKGKLIKKEEF
tara:strand:- start:212 stop:877 length:666 start_codon:yes stop_codon:yes gene_type:complete